MKFDKIRKFIVIITFVGSFTSTTAFAQEVYPINIRSAFLSSCLLGMTPDFNNESEVDLLMRYCLCMLDKIQEQYSLEEFVKISQSSGDLRDQQLEDFISNVAPSCL